MALSKVVPAQLMLTTYVPAVRIRPVLKPPSASVAPTQPELLPG